MTCSSPKIRFLVYKKLEETGREFIVEPVGNTGPGRDMCPWSGGLGYSPKRLMTWMKNGRIFKEDMIEAYERSTYTYFTREDILELYEQGTSHDRKYELLTKMCTMGAKYGIFDTVRLRKIIKKIQLT